jgi:hypothetical protein
MNQGRTLQTNWWQIDKLVTIYHGSHLCKDLAEQQKAVRIDRVVSNLV